MYAFLSYQTADKIVAGEVKGLLNRLGISAFLAHEDIEVSIEWRLKILKELRLADLFIPLLSSHYYQSPWCVQESGMAAFKKRICIIPLSLDGSIPQGFIRDIQSTRIEAGNIKSKHLLPGIAKKNVAFVIGLITNWIKDSGSFRNAEANFEKILPYLDRATDAQIANLLNVSTENGQVLHASLCARNYLPPLFKSYGHLLDEETRQKMRKVLAEYAEA